MKAYAIEGDTPSLPGRALAVPVALMHLQLLDLLPAETGELFVQHVGGMRQNKVMEDGSTGYYDKLVTVHFGRKIDGIEVSGPGSKIVVHLGAYGELAGLNRRWVETKGCKRLLDNTSSTWTRFAGDHANSIINSSDTIPSHDAAIHSRAFSNASSSILRCMDTRQILLAGQ
jgi:hypothetical protein